MGETLPYPLRSYGPRGRLRRDSFPTNLHKFHGLLMDKDKYITAIKLSEEKLESSREAIEMLKAVMAGLDESHPDYVTNTNLIYAAELSYSFTLMRLTIKKAQLGVVGSGWYEVPDKPP